MKKHGNNPADDKMKDKNKADETVLDPVMNEDALPDASIEDSNKEAKLESELSEARDKHLRLSAEFDNYRKRVQRERLELMKMAGTEIILSVIPVLDDLERALQSMKETDPAREGLKLIYNKLLAILDSKGLKAMQSVGKPFDPELHDAITNIPAKSPDQKGLVADEIEKGNYLHDKVIRHAKVTVAN